MKKLFLHIGTHKTGTTSIQRFAAAEEAALAEKGLIYPRAGRPFVAGIDDGHHLLPWTQTRHTEWKTPWGLSWESPDSVWIDLRREIEASPCPEVFISSEEFDVLQADQIARVAEALGGLQVEVICYLRRLDEFVQAYYVTNVLYNGETQHIDAFAESLIRTHHYFKLVERWRRAFGIENVHVRFYLRETLESRDVVTDLFHHIGYDIRKLRKRSGDMYVNTSRLPTHVIEAVRTLNELQPPADIIQRFLQIARRICAEHPKLGCEVLGRARARQLAECGVDSIERLGLPGFTPQIRSAFLEQPELDEPESDRDEKRPFAGLRTCLEEIERRLMG